MDHIVATYRLRAVGEALRELARKVAVELTVEVPDPLIDRYPDIEGSIIPQIETAEEVGAETSILRLHFSPALADGGLPQWLNLLSGNVSMMPQVELLDAEFPAELLSRFPGPSHGIAGLRERLGVFGRPIIATALKPRGARSKISRRWLRPSRAAAGR